MPETRFATGGHPSPEQLADFGRGEIDGLLADRIEAHLADCPACLEALQRSRPDDPWLDLLRIVGPSGSPPDAAGEDGPALASGYELEGIIGRGGMGVVHRARQLGLERRVALKMIAAGRDASPQMIERFRREVEAAASLNHPAIVPIFDVGVRDGVPFYAMELLEGGTLADRLAAGPLPTAEAVALLERLAGAVEHAHGQGIVHRDLKPSNILFDAGGAAKVADFGLAKRLDDDPAAATRSSLLLGTPTYMAPEQVDGRSGAIGPSVDVHALGAILFECLTGRPPFLAPSPLETLALIRMTDPPSPSQFRPGIPADLGTICLACLEKDPARRYASAAALAEDLGRFARGETILARPAGPIDRAAKWARRRPAEAAFAALLVLSMAGTIVGLLTHQARLRAALRREAVAAEESRRQRGIAESNYRDAHAAITRVLAVPIDPRYAGAPRLLEVHQAQAEAALVFYDRMLARAGSTDPAIRHDTARAAVEAANLQIMLGRAQPAEANLLRAGRLYDDLLADSPADPALLRDRMVAQIKLGVLLMADDTARAVTALETALELARRHAGLSGADTGWADKDLGWCEHNLGATWQLAQRVDRALPHYERAVAHYRTASARDPENVGLLVELAQSLINLGLARAATGGLDGAEADYREAGDLLDRAIAARPGIAEYAASRCDLLVNWGNLDVERGRTDAALGRFGRGLGEILPLHGAEPNMPRLTRTVINLHGARALALEKAGRHLEAAEDWARLVALEGTGPSRRSYALGRLLCLARGGDHRAIAAEAGAMEAEADLPAVDRYNLGCVLALASDAAPEGHPDRDGLRDRALAAVVRALADDPNLRATAGQDADLRPLAGLPAFRRALERP